MIFASEPCYEINSEINNLPTGGANEMQEVM